MELNKFQNCKEEITFFKENWILIIWWSLIKGLVYGFQAAIIALMVKAIWKG